MNLANSWPHLRSGNIRIPIYQHHELNSSKMKNRTVKILHPGHYYTPYKMSNFNQSKLCLICHFFWVLIKSFTPSPRELERLYTYLVQDNLGINMFVITTVLLYVFQKVKDCKIFYLRIRSKKVIHWVAFLS